MEDQNGSLKKKKQKHCSSNPQEVIEKEREEQKNQGKNKQKTKDKMTAHFKT